MTGLLDFVSEYWYLVVLVVLVFPTIRFVKKDSTKE